MAKKKKSLHIKSYKNIAKVFFISLGFVIIFSAAGYLGYEELFVRNHNGAKDPKACTLSETSARNQLNQLPDIKDFFSRTKEEGINTPYIKVDLPIVTGQESKVGYAYVGEKTENNSMILYSKYFFITSCHPDFQKLNDNDNNFSSLKFDYIYKMAKKTYSDETTQCVNDLSKATQIDFDKDGTPEILYGCFNGPSASTIRYNLYHENDEGKIVLWDSLNSSGTFDDITDYNNDGYPDISTSEILMDVGGCKGDNCFAPADSHDPSAKRLLKQSYKHTWNPTLQKFDSPVKAEIYYIKDNKKIIFEP